MKSDHYNTTTCQQFMGRYDDRFGSHQVDHALDKAWVAGLASGLNMNNNFRSMSKLKASSYIDALMPAIYSLCQHVDNIDLFEAAVVAHLMFPRDAR
ncbi:MAG: hypothetical protein WCO00_05225 [Rhodospirillaceae bacterium]